MRDRADKIAGAAHIKHHTKGTSNEISFSVLDAAKAAKEGEARASEPKARLPRLGSIPLFTLGRVKKPVATPVKERGLHLSTGEFVSAEDGQVKGSSTPQTVPGIAVEGSAAASGGTTAGIGGTAAAVGGVSAGAAGASLAGTAGAVSAGASAGGGIAGGAGGASGALSVASSAGLDAAGGLSPSTSSGVSQKGAGSSRRSAVTAPAWETPFEEVARRKANRKRHRRLALAGVSLVVMLLLAVGAAALYAGLQMQQDKKSQLIDCIRQIEETDDIILPFDDLVIQASSKPLEQLADEGFALNGEGQQAPPPDGSLSSSADGASSASDASDASSGTSLGASSDASGATSQSDAATASSATPQPNAAAAQALGVMQLEEAERTLAEVKQSVESLQAGVVDNEIKEAANQALISINARLNMIQSGSAALKETLRVLTPFDHAQKGWDLILQGDAAARAAAALVAEISADNVNASMEKSNEAIGLFSQAREQLVEAQAGYEVELDPFLYYIDLRIESQRLALSSDQAYLDRDKEMLAEANEAYNKADTEAVALIKEQKGNPQTLVSERFEQNTQADFDSYAADRARAAAADAFLRDYLGSMGK
ncbi:hypothetical protein [Adlercreutzia sp. ZJ242]|uniref:hypothetical protein n=1 Tax=Adlercreutzia sp. ZJ242 TaxID=2709409 RepID=UPI00197F7DAC|nr:hypothetical protein [Adlercreutzia sp. ZJ242]